MTREQKRAMGIAVNKVAGKDATIMLLVWDPKWRAFLPGGASRAEIETCFPEWTITHVEPAAANQKLSIRFLKQTSSGIDYAGSKRNKKNETSI